MPSISNSLAPLPPGRQRRSISKEGLLANATSAAQGVRVGRPKLYHPDLCDRAVALGKRGKSWAGIARDFGISRNTLNTWESENEAFRDALARARAAAQAWWEDHGQRNLKADRYQAQVHKNIMAAQFEDYREQRSDSVGGFDLSAFVGAVAQAGAAVALAGKGQPGDDAKVIEGSEIKVKP